MIVIDNERDMAREILEIRDLVGRMNMSDQEQRDAYRILRKYESLLAEKLGNSIAGRVSDQ